MGKKARKRARMNSSNSNMSSAPPTPTDNLTYAIHSANETIYGQHPGITGTSPLTPTHTLYNLQPRQYAPNIMYTSTPNIGFHSDPPPARSGQGQPIQMSTTTDPLPCQNINTVLNDIQQKLQKLDILDSISERLRNIEGKFDIVEKDISQLKQSVNIHDQRLNTNDQDMRGFHHRISELEGARDELSVLTSELHESFLSQQTRSMKYNLIFENISEETVDPPAAENTEDVLRKFIRDELHITDEIHFQNVHRLKVRRDRKPRGIIARFVYFKDKETVLKAARTSLRDKPQKIYSQFPQEIGNRRRELVPIMKDFRDSGHRAYIDVDKLYVDGKRYIPNPDERTRLRHRPQIARGQQNYNVEQRQVRFS